MYDLDPSESQRVSYPLDAGPVEISSSNGAKIIVAIRDAWKVNGQVLSFVQMMGLPQEALSSTYWFPAYNNVTSMDSSALACRSRHPHKG